MAERSGWTFVVAEGVVPGVMIGGGLGLFFGVLAAGLLKTLERRGSGLD